MFAVFWRVEIFTDAEGPANKQHRKPTSSAIHLSMELRLHGANLLFLCPQLKVNFIQWRQVVWMESTSKHVFDWQGSWTVPMDWQQRGQTVGLEMFDALKREQNLCLRDGETETPPRFKIWCWQFCKLPGMVPAETEAPWRNWETGRFCLSLKWQTQRDSKAVGTAQTGSMRSQQFTK